MRSSRLGHSAPSCLHLARENHVRFPAGLGEYPVLQALLLSRTTVHARSHHLDFKEPRQRLQARGVGSGSPSWCVGGPVRTQNACSDRSARCPGNPRRARPTPTPGHSLSRRGAGQDRCLDLSTCPSRPIPVTLLSLVPGPQPSPSAAEPAPGPGSRSPAGSAAAALSSGPGPGALASVGGRR